MISILLQDKVATGKLHQIKVATLSDYVRADL